MLIFVMMRGFFAAAAALSGTKCEMPVMPNAVSAIVVSEKLTAYLLSQTHPVGRTKAAFFQRFGFDISGWPFLRDALLDHARSQEVTAVIDTPFGQKFIVEGALSAPDGRSPRVRSIWFIETGQENPRLVTVVPVPGGGE